VWAYCGIVFGSPHGGMPRSFTGSADDPDQYWSDVAGRHAEHARHADNLVIVMVLIGVAATFVGWPLLGAAAAIGCLALVELWMWRRSRP
jgi:hypothetical protein